MSCINSSQRFNPFPAKTICAADAVPSKKSFAANRLSQSDKKKRKKKQICFVGQWCTSKGSKSCFVCVLEGEWRVPLQKFLSFKKKKIQSEVLSL